MTWFFLFSAALLDSCVLAIVEQGRRLRIYPHSENEGKNGNFRVNTLSGITPLAKRSLFDHL